MSHRAVNGDLVQLETVGNELAHVPWFDHVRFLPRYGHRGTTADGWGLDVAPVASLGAAIESVRGRLRHRFTLAGGEVLVVDAAVPPRSRWAAWAGPWHLVHGMFYAPDWETTDIAETFTRVRWTDTPDGLTADPGRAFGFGAVMCRLRIAGVGSLRIEAKSVASARPPRWRGAQVPSGEVWQLPDRSGVSRPSLLLAGATAVALLVPDAGAEERAVEFLAGVRRLDWAA
jgi:hypothetical protein